MGDRILLPVILVAGSIDVAILDVMSLLVNLPFEYYTPLLFALGLAVGSLLSKLQRVIASGIAVVIFGSVIAILAATYPVITLEPSQAAINLAVASASQRLLLLSLPGFVAMLGGSVIANLFVSKS